MGKIKTWSLENNELTFNEGIRIVSFFLFFIFFGRGGDCGLITYMKNIELNHRIKIYQK